MNLYSFGTRMPKTTQRTEIVRNRAVTVPSPRCLRTEAARNVLFPCGCCGACTMTARFPYDLHTVSVRLCLDLTPKARARNRTVLVYNVNTYAVACSHLRYLKNRKENRRQITYGVREKCSPGITYFCKEFLMRRMMCKEDFVLFLFSPRTYTV